MIELREYLELYFSCPIGHIMIVANLNSDFSLAIELDDPFLPEEYDREWVLLPLTIQK